MADRKKGGFTSVIETKLMPVAVKLSQFKPLIAIRDGIAAAMPLIIIGSLFMIISSFPITAWTNWIASVQFQGVSLQAIFGKISNGSFGLLGLIGCFGIASSYAEQHETDGKSAGIIAIASYFVVTPYLMSGDKVPAAGMPYDFLGSKGLFVGIIIGLVTGGLFQWFINHDVQIHMPDTVPPAIAKSFSALIPGAVIISLFGLVYLIVTWAGWGNIHLLLLNILSGPLGLLGDTLGGTLVAVFLNSAFWFVGIHGANTVNNVIQPIWLMNTGANHTLFEAGKLDLAHGGHIIAQPFIDNFVFMGGGGATLGLVIGVAILVFMKKSSKQLEILAPLTLTPGIFNINEPTMFGMPIVLNTTLVIPFVLAPMVNVLTTYLAMKSGIVGLCTGVVVPWTMPPILSGFLATNTWQASVLQAINIVLDVLVYFPFLLTQNKQQKLEESGKLDAE
ncbi:PTS sugar transporter subunit IIC [Lacticaseibacillus suilingensis]|uniref:Permease IIC component n=1 Tax=Lacticaseibacillus suilingensis TaxID=2799577 RepID=A0ABW4BD24_9LACO|nr:PTS sugar transporter subunit IIC [Lacticaseibacillus suilingensis]